MRQPDMMSAMSLSSPLSQYLSEQMQRLGWSARRLAQEAGISSSGLSAIMRGKVIPETATLQRIADALAVDTAHLLRLAGLFEAPAPLDPTVAYVSRRLQALPPETRDVVVRLVISVLDSVDLLTSPRNSQPPEANLSAEQGSNVTPQADSPP
jgi:transcriptional regulator with XRE-family HTH domain